MGGHAKRNLGYKKNHEIQTERDKSKWKYNVNRHEDEMNKSTADNCLEEWRKIVREEQGWKRDDDLLGVNEGREDEL